MTTWEEPGAPIPPHKLLTAAAIAFAGFLVCLYVFGASNGWW